MYLGVKCEREARGVGGVFRVHCLNALNASRD